MTGLRVSPDRTWQGVGAVVRIAALTEGSAGEQLDQRMARAAGATLARLGAAGVGPIVVLDTGAGSAARSTVRAAEARGQALVVDLPTDGAGRLPTGVAATLGVIAAGERLVLLDIGADEPWASVASAAATDVGADAAPALEPGFDPRSLPAFGLVGPTDAPSLAGALGAGRFDALLLDALGEPRGPAGGGDTTGLLVVRGASRAADDRAAIDRRRATGAVRTADELLRPVIPSIADEATYLDAVDRLDPWWRAITEVCRREGLRPDAAPRIISDGQFPVIHLPPHAVLKLYGPWRYGPRSWACESVANGAFAADPGLPVPRSIGEGRLAAEWWYSVVTFVPGTSLRHAWPRLDATELRKQMTWVGRFLRRLHDLPVPTVAHETDWPWFAMMLRWHHRNALQELTRHGSLPAHLVAQVADWLPPLEKLLEVPGGPRLLHADLKDEHVLGTLDGARFDAAAVIDWGRAMVGHPYYELGPVYRRVCHGRADLLSRVLEATELPGRDDPGFARTALSYLILHAADSFADSPHVRTATDLDDLAARIFGG